MIYGTEISTYTQPATFGIYIASLEINHIKSNDFSDSFGLLMVQAVTTLLSSR